MKATCKKLICTALCIALLLVTVPASLVSALKIDLNTVNWDSLGALFGLSDSQIDDLKAIVEEMNESDIQEIVDKALEESEAVHENLYVAVFNEKTREYYSSLSLAIQNCGKNEMILILDAAGLDVAVDADVRIVFNTGVDSSALQVSPAYAAIKGTYVFVDGSTEYELYMFCNVDEALKKAAEDLDNSDPAYTAALEQNSDGVYELTLTVDYSEVTGLFDHVRQIVSDAALAVAGAFPLFDSITIGDRCLYDGEQFLMAAANDLISDLLALQTPDGLYQLAYRADNRLFAFPITLQYNGSETVSLDVTVLLDATDSELDTVKTSLKKVYSRLHVEENTDGTYTVDVDATGFFAALAKKSGYEAYYDLATEDGIRAFLDDRTVSWICDRILAYDGEAYADVANLLQRLVNRFVKTERYEEVQNKTLADAYEEAGVYAFSLTGTYNYSSLLKTVSSSTAAYGFDYDKLVSMCNGDLTVTRTAVFRVKAYDTGLKQSASDVVDGVLDALSASCTIERSYTDDGILNGINLVLQSDISGSVADVLEALLPVYLVFDSATLNGVTVYQKETAVSLRSALAAVYAANPVTFETVASMSGNTLQTYDLQLVYGDVLLNIPVSVSLGCSDDMLAALKSAAAKLAGIVTMEVSAEAESLTAEISVDLTDHLSTLLDAILPSLVSESYEYIRTELNKMSVQELLDQFTEEATKLLAESLGLGDQYDSFVSVYEDLLSLVDAHASLQKLLDEKYEAYGIEALLTSLISQYYQNDGTYFLALADESEGITASRYLEKLISSLRNTIDVEEADRLLGKFGLSSVEELIDSFRSSYDAIADSVFAVNANITLILFDTYEVTFLDEDGNELEVQTVVAGDAATDPTYHGGALLGMYYEADVDYDNVLSDLVVTLTPIHDYDDGVVTVEPTCSTPGEKTFTCKYCDDSYTEEIPATGEHTYGDPVWTWSENHDSATATFTCIVCGDVQTVTAVVETDTTNATCGVSGEIVYTATVTFGETTYTDVQTVEIPATGEHTYGDPVWTWSENHGSATATFTCIVCGDVQTVTAVVETDTTNATCGVSGEIVYTATVTFGGTTYTDVQTVEIPATGEHTYGDPVWNWSDDYSSVTVSFSCVICDDVVQTVSAELEIQKTDATCGAAGEIIYTATVTFGGKTYTDIKTVEIPATGAHTYVTEEIEGTDCHHPSIKRVVCSVCGEVKSEETTDVYYPPLTGKEQDVAFISNILVVKIEKMTVAAFKTNFYEDVTVYDKNGNKLSDSDYVGTNGTFTCGYCGTEFTIAVIGDVNGDGVVNPKDYMMIKRYVLDTYELTGAPLAAADVNVSLKVDAKDYMMVKLYVLDKYDFYRNVPDWDTVSHLVTEFV